MSGGRTVDTMVLILRTQGCSWSRESGCSMCGYNSASEAGITADDLIVQVDAAMDRYRDEPFVKIYTSGSFLDEREVPLAAREEIVRRFEGVERLLVESRPEFITKESLASLPAQTTMALGMESASDRVLRDSINKGFLLDDHLRAVKALQEAELAIRSYVLLKPPFLSERAAMADSLAAVRLASGYADEISINPLNVQRGTLVERLWRRGEYRPPWIWSLATVLEQGLVPDGPRIMSSPSGGGTKRGVHNCGSCDKDHLKIIERFSFTQDLDLLSGLSCDCHGRWERMTEAEAALGTSVDLDRALDDGLAV